MNSNNVEKLKNKIISGQLINKNEALLIINEDCDILGQAANEIRKYFCENEFDLSCSGGGASAAVRLWGDGAEGRRGLVRKTAFCSGGKTQ